MHIVQMIDVLTQGGAQKLLVTFAEEARAHDIKLSVISLSIPDDFSLQGQLESLGAAVYYFPARRLADIKLLLRLMSWLWKERPDLIHAHLTYSNIIGTFVGRL